MILLDLNVRLDVKSDGIYNYWIRKPYIDRFIYSHHPDLIALQEFLPHMLEDLLTLFGKDYAIYATPRDRYGESIPIMIKKDVFEVLEQDTLWLSNTPEMSSKLNGSAFPRVMSYAVLRHLVHHRKLIFINTHLDYAFDDVIYNQAVILNKHIETLIQSHRAPILLTGDFNQFPSTKAISYLSSLYCNIYEKTGLKTNTFHGFKMTIHEDPIDYIFTSHDVMINGFTVYQQSDDQTPLSDHYPLVLDFDY